MERRRAAAALLALAACFACSAAAPTASNPTALELHDGPSEGCYYNFQHYGEGDRIMTNEPCLNCTCHNRMLMCYLRVCPFTKAIGQDCTVEKRADQCCPIVTCPDVPVDLLTSTSTSSPAEYGPTGVGKLDKYGCSINNKYFPEGSKVPSSPNKPCEHCYCIRNMTTCVMQECTLHVDGCTPIYHKDVCCPVRYSCDHLEDEIPLLDDMTTTVRPTQGFLLTTTTMIPVTQITQDCIHDEQIFPDGASIKTDKACEHCYCMKGDIVCVVQECGTPMENEGKNCTSLPPRQGQCCPDTYICEGDEPSLDLTTETIDLTSAPPRRLGVEGSGYRNEPDEPYTDRAPLEHEIEGSGDLSETDIPTKIASTIRDESLIITTEKEVPYSQTTEADKDLNIITDKISEKEPSVTFEEDSFRRPTESVLMTSTESKATLADEIILTDGVTSKHDEDDIHTKAPFHSYEGDEMLPTDSAIEKETSLNVPDQSTLMDEHSVTEATTSIMKELEITLGSAEIVTPKDITTTERSVVINVTENESSNDETSEINKIDIMSEMTIADISVTEQNKPDFGYTTIKELNIVDDVTTVSSKKDTTESTSINPVDNEVDYIPGRIPGEGDCLLNGITYNNNTSVPSTNNCHSGCKCISSIVKCDPIICSPPPEYMENMNDCQTSYDTPDACCPTYVCSAKETSLPQSHSQTSVTESSKPIAGVECNGNECSSDEVKQQSSEPNKICDSGNCESESTQNECGINGCQGEEQTPLERPSNCSGGKCSVAPTVICDSENCETAPTEEKDVDDKIHSESQGKPICNDADGCDNVKNTSPKQDECKDESCRRKDTFETETNIQAECSGTQCKIDNEQKIPHIEPTIAPVTEYIINQENTEIDLGELDTQKTVPPVLNIITPEKTVVTESTINIDTEPATVKVQLPDETLNDVTNTEEPVKLITESAISITDNTVTKTEEDITKSETSSSELTPMSDSATEKTITFEEISTEQGSYTSAPGLDKTEAFTESKLVDYTSENKDTSSDDYTKEVSQKTTEKSETLSDIYETKPDESFTKLPIVKDTEKEIYTTKTPKFPENEVKVTGSEDYPMATDKIVAISVSDEILGITKQPTVIQENVQTELPESAMEIESDNRDHSDLVPTEMQDLTTEIVENDKIEDYNKFTTVKSITLSGDNENQTPMKTETQSIISGTVSSESTTPEIILADIHKTYTELPQSLGTKSDINESDNKFEEPTTISSDVKQPEEFSTKLDEAMPEDGHSETETENPDYATTEGKPSILNDDKLNVDLTLDVTEKQTTTSQIKHTDEKEIEEELQTKLPKVDEITKRTELEMTTESYKETEMKDFEDRDLQTISPLDSKITESDIPYTSNEGLQPSSELTPKDQYLVLQTSTTPQDISLTKDTTTAAVLRDENDIEITSSTDKNELKITSSSDESVTEIIGGQELMTELPRETIEHHPTKDFKLTTLYSENTVIPIETTTTFVISEEKQQTPDLGVPEEAKETIKDITTANPLLTKEIIGEDIPSSKLPDLISQSEDTSAIPSDEEKMTTSSNDNIKEEEKTEINLEEIAQTTTSNIHISESITEKIDMQPQDHPTHDSSADESSEKSDVTEKYLITESPYSQTSSIDSNISNIAPEEYEVDQNAKLPASAINDDNKPISTSIPLLTQDNEIIITEKIPTPGLSEEEATTEKSEYDFVPDKNKQPSEAMPSESNTDHDIFQNSVTEETKTTEVSPYESELQNSGITGSVQEDEKSSPEVTKQTTETPLESELTIQEEHQTIASETSSSISDTEIEDVRTTESVPIKQEDLPIYPDMPVESIHTISDESYTTATTEVVPRKHEELPIQPEIAPIPTVLPNLDTTKGDEGVSKIESATLPTESSETGKPSLITSTEVSKTDTTKLIDVFEEQQLSSKVPEPSIETTSRTETEVVTEPEGTEPYTTEKQYISISDQEEVPKVPELPAEHAQIDTETENKEEDFGTATTEKQYVTKSDQEDIPKIPVLIDEQSTSQGDIESVTELDHTEHVTTVDQYVTKANERVPEIPKLPEEQNIDQTYPDVVSEKEDSEAFTTEKTYVTKLDQESPKFPEQSVEQSTSRIDTESIIKLDDTQPSVTEKHYLTDSPQDEVPKIPEEVEEQSTSRIDTESITKLEETQPSVTEKQHVTDSPQDEVPKVPEQIEEQSTSRIDTESITNLEDTQPSVTEKQYVTDSPQDEVPKVPEQIEEQSTSRIDTESITKLEDTQPSVTEKQHVTDSPQDEVPKVTEQIEEQSTSRIDTESITKLEDTQPSVTEKQHVTDSPKDEVPKVPEQIEEQSTSRIDTESITKLEDTQPSVTEKQHVTDSPQDEVPKVPEQIEEQSTSRIDTESITKLEETQPSVTEKQHLTDSPQDEVPKVPEQFEEQSTSRIDTESITKLEETQPSVTEKQYVTDSPQDEVPKIPVVIDEQSTSQSGTEDITKLIDIEAYTTEKQYVTKSDEDVSKIQEPSEEQSTTRTDIENEMKQEDSKSSTTEKPFVTKTDQEDIQNILVSVDEQSTSQSDIESVTKLDDTEFFVTEKQYSMTNSDQEEVHKIPVVIDEESTSKGDRETINDIEPYTTEKQYVTKSDEDVSKIQEPSEEQSTTRTDIENEMKQEDSKSSTTEKPFVTKTDQEDIQNILVSVDEQSTSQSDIESVTKLDDTEFFVTEKQYSMTNSDQEDVHKIPVVIDEESTSKGDRETINDIEPYTTEKQYVTKSDEDVSKIQEPSEEQSTTRTDIENEMKQDDSKSSTTEKPFVTKTDQEDIQNILVSVDEQSTSQSDIESVTKLDDTEFFVTEKQYSMTNSDQEEVHKIPVVIDEESTSKGDRETINDIEPYTTEKQYVTKLGEEVQELPKEPTEEQSTDRIYTEVVSKSEDSGLFTTERQFVTKLEQEVPKIPEQNEDQSTSRYDSESVTKLEDIEPFVTEKQYVSSSGEEETSKFPVQSEEQTTSRIDTESVTTMEDSGTDHEIPSSHKLDTDVSKPDLDNKNIETITPEPSNYPDTTIKSELEGSDLIKPSEDVTVVPQKEDSTELNPTDISIPEKVETPTKTVTENLDDFEKYSTERNVQTSGPAGETVILEEVTDAKPYETEHKTPSKSSTDEEGTFSETTPYSVLLEEHTHLVLEETSSSIPIEEGTTLRNEVLPERGDQIPDTPEINDEYEHTTAKQVEVDKTTVYEKISSPVVQSDATETTTIIEKITSDSSSQGEDNKYSPSTPVVLPTIKEKEQHTTPPTILEKEITTLGGIIAGSEEPEITSSSSKGDSTQELLPSSTSKLQEESTTHLPSSEDKYKEKPFTSAPSPSSSELPEILEEPHEEEHSPDFPPSGAGAGYGQEPDYVEEDQAFGPGTCRYGGKVYVSAQQIPRDDPCDFCFCFRSDIICLQQSCPPPIHGCHEEPIQGFCCPRYECPVSMATTVNVTTTTTTTTTTLPPHFLPHAYKGAAQRRGCQIKGHSYKVGEVVRASSGPCLHCTCGGDGQMKCDPKACTPEPMLRQMIAAAVSAKRRR